jgi:hypothetical protein
MTANLGRRKARRGTMTATVDPLSILGLPPDASPEEVSAAYRRLAKRWHPDRARDHAAQARMAEINAAYDTLRAGFRRRRGGPHAATGAERRPRGGPGAGLPESVRRALGPELLRALQAGEQVRLVTPTSTWASPQTLLAVTDRRLLWLLDDAVSHRVRSLRLGAITAVEHRPRWLLGRSAVLRLRTTEGRRLSFAELRPATAALIADHVLGARTALAG